MTTKARIRRWAEAGRDINDSWSEGARPQDKQFELTADFKMTGDQPQAVAKLSDSIANGAAHQTMMQIQHQHVQFGLVGFGIAISKAIADTERFHRRAMQIVFAVLMLILGLLLMNYTE